MDADMDVSRRLTAALAVVLMTVAASVQAASLPGPTIPSNVGVNIHFTRGNTQSLDLMAAAGIRVVRMDFVWSTTETSKGSYDWSAYDELLGNLEARGLQPYFILDFSNALYEQTRVNWVGAYPSGTYVSAPQHPASVAAFTAWAKAAAAHFAGHNIIWEIWNEPNLATFWKPGPDAAKYGALALGTCSAIRSADSSAVVIGPASSAFPWDFLTTVFSSGLLNCFDAVSVHPYRSTAAAAPETAASDYTQLVALIAKYAPSSRSSPIPIISGEWGYYTASSSGVTTAVQADYVVRQQLFNLLNGVNLSIWYDWMNDGSDASNAEHNFGLVNTDLSPKPSYTALQTMTQQLSGYRLLTRVSTSSSLDYVLAFMNDSGQVKLVYWTTGTAHSLSLAPVVSGSQLATQNLPLTSSPQYSGVLATLGGAQ